MWVQRGHQGSSASSAGSGLFLGQAFAKFAPEAELSTGCSLQLISDPGIQALGLLAAAASWAVGRAAVSVAVLEAWRWLWQALANFGRCGSAPLLAPFRPRAARGLPGGPRAGHRPSARGSGPGPGPGRRRRLARRGVWGRWCEVRRPSVCQAEPELPSWQVQERGRASRLRWSWHRSWPEAEVPCSRAVHPA